MPAASSAVEGQKKWILENLSTMAKSRTMETAASFKTLGRCAVHTCLDPAISMTELSHGYASPVHRTRFVRDARLHCMSCMFVQGKVDRLLLRVLGSPLTSCSPRRSNWCYRCPAKLPTPTVGCCWRRTSNRSPQTRIRSSRGRRSGFRGKTCRSWFEQDHGGRRLLRHDANFAVGTRFDTLITVTAALMHHQKRQSARMAALYELHELYVRGWQSHLTPCLR